MRICKTCEEEFRLLPGKPGLSTICPICTELHPVKGEPQKLMAEVSWENKHTPIITVTTPERAKAFNDKLNRRGFTPNLPFSPPHNFEPGEKLEDRENSVIGFDYRTKLGESRRVK